MTYIKQNAMHVEMQSTSLVVSIGAVKNHENTPKHLRNFNNNNNKNNNNKNQLQFVVKKKGTVSMESVDKSVRYLYYRRTKMESGDFKGVKCSRDKNHSIESCKEDNMLYSKMFPNSEIAKNYEMSVTKV